MQKTDWTIHPSSPSYVVLDVTNRGTITTIFLYIGPFLAWWPTNNQMILVQALSWPGWKKKSSAISDLSMWRWWNQLGAKSAARSTHPRGPNQSRNTHSNSLQHSFCLSNVNFKKSRKLIGEQHIYFNIFLTKVFIHYPPRNCSGGNCPADTPHEELYAERGSLKVIKMEFYKSSYLRFEIL